MFKLTLRELSLIVALATVLVAWSLDRARQLASRSEVETRAAATELRLVTERDKATSAANRFANLYMSACQACSAHGLAVRGSGKNARLVENNGEDFKRSNRAEPYVLVDGNP
jgi:hypothetical protein